MKMEFIHLLDYLEQSYGFVEIIFTESSDPSGCYGAITFEIIISSGEFGEDPNAGPDTGGPGPNTGPIDVPETTAGLGEAPYPGDPGFCSSDTQIIELPEVLTTTIENTVTTQISHPLLDEPGISIANVYTNDSSIATVKAFNPQNNSLILEITGQMGGVAIVLEVRKAGDLAAEDCAAVMFFILGVIDPGEIDCQVTQSFEPIFVEPGTQNALIDLTPFFDAFGGFETYSQSFKLDIVDPFLTVGQVFLDGTELSFEFNGIEGFDMLVFQNSDLNGNCINLLEVPVIVDPDAASLNPDSGGIGSQGPDEGLNSDCPGSFDLGTGEDAFYFELGNTSVNVDLSDAFQVIDILPSEVQIEAFISSEVGGNSGTWEIDATNTFSMQVPSGEYYIVVDLYIKDPSTGQCLGVIIFDVAAFDTTENCIATTLDPDAANEVVWFSPGEGFEQDFSDFFISTQGNALEIEITLSNDLVTVNDLGQGNFGFTAGDQSGEGEISIIVTDPSADCIFEILSIPFLVDPTPPEGQGPPPDFNCPQYIEDIMPIYASMLIQESLQ
jgi:hypothetical protein